MEKTQHACKQKPTFHILAPNDWEQYLENPNKLLDQTTLDATLKIMTILSTSSHIKKSLTALHLAECFASDGYKTLLLEANVRTPFFDTYFNFECKKGLSDTIGSEDNHIIHYKTHLDVLSGGSPIEDATSFLLGRQFKQYLHALKNKYDKIIIDAPTLNGHHDALILRDYACGSIVVHDE